MSHFGTTAFLLVAFFAYVEAPHAGELAPERQKAIEEITALSWKDPQLNQRLDLAARQVLTAINIKNQIAGSKAAAIARAEMIRGITEVYASALDKNFSTSELLEIVAFQRSAAGRKFSTKMAPELLAGLTDIAPRLQERIEKAISAIEREPTDKPVFDDAGQRVFYSEDIAKFGINALLYVRKESDRVYRGRIISEYKYGSEFSFYLFCVSRQLAKERGADYWALTIVKDDPYPYVIGSLSSEEKSDPPGALGPLFARAQVVATEEPRMVSMCDKQRGEVSRGQ